MSAPAIVALCAECGDLAAVTVEPVGDQQALRRWMARGNTIDVWELEQVQKAETCKCQSGLPRIALRNDSEGGLDDVVVTGVRMFRAERMSDQDLWLCCYLTNGERITWSVAVSGRSRLPLRFDVGETPDEYRDYDEPEPVGVGHGQEQLS